MLTRRGFSSFTACAICGITEFVATEAFAQGTQPAATPGGLVDLVWEVRSRLPKTPIATSVPRTISTIFSP